jgi:fatty acid CoA ligase FadD21
MPSPTVLSLLRERAGLQPNDTAYTYTDYEQYRHHQFTRLDA